MIDVQGVKTMLGRLRTGPRRLALLGALMALTVVLLWTARPDDPPDEASGQWLWVEPGPVEQQLGLVGRIHAARQETLAAPFDGSVSELLVHHGQAVEAGQALLRLDPAQLDIQLRQAEAERIRARQEVRQWLDWHRSPELTRARRAVHSAQATLAASRQGLRDTRLLLKRGIVARMEVDALGRQVQALEQDLIAAQEELRTLQARSQGEAPRLADMALSNADARYQALVAQRQRQVVRAPFAGVVVRPPASADGQTSIPQTGVQAAQGAPLVTVVGRDHLQVVAWVDETDLRLLCEGMPVQVTGDGFARHTLTGRVTTIAVQGTAVEAPGAAARYEVVVSVEEPSAEARRLVRLGMSARLLIALSRNERGLVLPPQALTTDDQGASHVWYRRRLSDVPSRQPVVPGRATVQGVEVKGLAAGYVRVP